MYRTESSWRVLLMGEHLKCTASSVHVAALLCVYRERKGTTTEQLTRAVVEGKKMAVLPLEGGRPATSPRDGVATSARSPHTHVSTVWPHVESPRVAGLTPS